MSNANRLRLNSLHIHRESPYAVSDKGKLIGTVEIESISGTITLKIDDKAAEAIIAICAEGLKNEAQRVAQMMTGQLLEAINAESGTLVLEHQA